MLSLRWQNSRGADQRAMLCGDGLVQHNVRIIYQFLIAYGHENELKLGGPIVATVEGDEVWLALSKLLHDESQHI